MEAIAVSVLSGIGALTLEKLDAFLSQEAKLLFGIGDDLQFIKYEVRWATAFLKDMSSESINENGSGEQLTEWLKQIKDLIYEAEDVLDEYKYHAARRGIIAGNECHILRTLKDVKAHRHIASHLNKLKLMARDVKERRERYNFKANARHDTSSLDPPLRPHYVQEDKLVGIASQRDAIINWLVEDKAPQLRVISIVGPGGMGKTTLAIKSYESPRVTNGQFSCRAHITLSQAFDFNKLMRSLFKQFFDDRFEAMTEKMKVEELVTEMGKQLSNKRYLVLLDDVWTKDAWDGFSCAFPDNGNGSRIIVTTRNDAVANTCSLCDPQYILRMQPLPHEQSKELFCKRVFLNQPFNCPPYLEELMEGILKQCGGMPLAIVTIAGILVSNKQSKEHWQRVHDHIGPQWKDGAENMSRILMLSYNDLPYDIKPCFLYLSMFPEDAELKRSNVVRRWIAEGLVNGGDAEQHAKSYFDELASRNLIDPAIITCEKVKRWKIHDLILELIIGKAVQENFVYIINKSSRDSKIRRISVQGEVNTLNGLDLSLIRSLSLSFPSYMLRITNFKKMRLLRMLDLNGCDFIVDRHIEQICETLLLLKHLGLGFAGISKLPKSIEMLQDLEVLNIRETEVKKLPRSFFKLKQLRHFYAGTEYNGMLPEEIMKLGNMGSSLRVLKLTLDELSVGVLKALGQLVHLEKLQIIEVNDGAIKDSGEIWQRTFLQALQDLSNSSLRSLSIYLDRSNIHFFTYDDLLLPRKLETIKLYGEFIIRRVPRWVESLHCVTKMYLRFFASTVESQQNDIRLLGSLPSLVILGLDVSDRREKRDATIDIVIC